MIFESITLSSTSRDQFINITRQVKSIAASAGIGEGMCTVYCPHTTAAITINESADPAVVEDMLAGLGKIAPYQAGYRHMEGNSDAHIKSSLLGISEIIPIHQGQLTLGTWQGIYFCEFDGPRTRKVYITVQEG